ncbi:MAG: hypothetical protein KGY80_13845 [Candidatus Thorarchaeota archaeon]|nr:hypothetical protein [Candidatus Thorarchaeota archaeon]
MTTISIKEETRRELLRIAGEIQQKTQERVDFDTVIQTLVNVYDRQKVDIEAWNEFVTPLQGVDFKSAYRDLISERRRDND